MLTAETTSVDQPEGKPLPRNLGLRVVVLGALIGAFSAIIKLKGAQDVDPILNLVSAGAIRGMVALWVAYRLMLPVEGRFDFVSKGMFQAILFAGLAASNIVLTVSRENALANACLAVGEGVFAGLIGTLVGRVAQVLLQRHQTVTIQPPPTATPPE